MILRLIKNSNGFDLEYQKEYQFKRPRSNQLIFAVNRLDVFDAMDFLKNVIPSYLNTDTDVRVVIENNMAEKDLICDNDKIEYIYSSEEMKKLIDFNNYLVEQGLKSQILFNEYFLTYDNESLKYCWYLNDVIKANNEIDKVVREIKGNKLSPYETMLYIHKYISANYGYGENASPDMFSNFPNIEKNCSVVSAVKFGQIICVGFASLVKAIVDKLDDENLKCEFQGLGCFKKSPIIDGFYRVDSHAICLVDINDEKYNIKGKYAEDVCADHKTMNDKNGRGFSSCMFPISDLYDYGDCVHIKTYGNRICGTKYDSDSEYYLKLKQGKPIPVETTVEALKVLYGHNKSLSNAQIYTKVKKDIQKSIKNAVKCFKPYAKSPYINTAYAKELASIEGEIKQ